MRVALRSREALASAWIQGGRLVLAERLDSTVYDHVARAIAGVGGLPAHQPQAFVFPSGDAAAAIAPLLLVREEAGANAADVQGRDQPGPDHLRPRSPSGDLPMLAMDDHGLMLRERRLKRRWRTAFCAVLLVWALLACTALLLDPVPPPRVCGSPTDVSVTPIPQGAHGAPWAANA